MDPSSISQPPPPSLAPPTTTVPFTTEPNNHPTGQSSATQPPAHPPYAEMIYTAIQALKEKDGSSKIAIGKYLQHVYKDQLPPTHSTLLTHHLKRLKTSGMLEMVKKSYKLPRSTDNSPQFPNAPPQFPDAPLSQTSRPRGRPRKNPVPAQAQTQAQPQPQAQAIPVQPQQQLPQPPNAEPVWAALGLADEPAAPVQPVSTEGFKKRPGRPRKSGPGSGQGPSPASATPARRGRGRPPGSKSNKKRPGRPPKAVMTENANATVAAAVAAGLPKRRPGRPPKNQQTQATPIPFAPPAGDSTGVIEAQPVPVEFGVVPVEAPRSRGRPRKNAVAGVAAAVAAVSAGRGRGRGRGRGGAGGRGRGRGLSVAGRRPVGRPRKVTTSASAPQSAATDELRTKLEQFQAKVKETVAVLRPHFNHESEVTAIAAIQELEELAAMDLNAPLREETLPQQEQPAEQEQLAQQEQLAPQQHVPPQQLPLQPPQYQQQLTEFHIQQFQQQQQLHYQQQPQLSTQQPFHP